MGCIPHENRQVREKRGNWWQEYLVRDLENCFGEQLGWGQQSGGWGKGEREGAVQGMGGGGQHCLSRDRDGQ